MKCSECVKTLLVGSHRPRFGWNTWETLAERSVAGWVTPGTGHRR